jgi:hypothetical protein
VLPQLSLAQLQLSSYQLLHLGLRLQAEVYLEQLAQGGFGSAMAKLVAHILFGTYVILALASSEARMHVVYK